MVNAIRLARSDLEGPTLQAEVERLTSVEDEEATMVERPAWLGQVTGA